MYDFGGLDNTKIDTHVLRYQKLDWQYNRHHVEGRVTMAI